jgi:hypothetical protein
MTTTIPLCGNAFALSALSRLKQTKNQKQETAFGSKLIN